MISDRLLWIFARSRFVALRRFAWRFMKIEGQAFSPSDSAIRILVGGDVSLNDEVRIGSYLGVYALEEKSGGEKERILSRVGRRGSGWDAPETGVVKKIIRQSRRKLIKIFYDFFIKPLLRYITAPIFYRPWYTNEMYSLSELLVKKPENLKRMAMPLRHWDYDKFSPKNHPDRLSYPFEKLSSFLKEKDLVLVNLETPLSDHRRAYGVFISDPRYAQSIKDAGISIVSLANNHMFDAGEIGFLDTLENLDKKGIPYVGGGKNFDEARLGKLIELRGTKLIILNYTQWCNMSYTSIASDYPGILPLDREIITEDIIRARDRADFVFVSLHWGIENDPIVHPRQVEIAHYLIDHGADAIIGHHPHLPQGVEIYREKPIIYSLGNLIFFEADKRWHSDNFMADIIIDQKRIQGVIIYPVSGKGIDLCQPRLLDSARADELLYELQIKSAPLNTGISIKNGLGYIKI
jgi:poly-gamma-glutamate synthesis protein (capsule biosynthesis protein)